MNTPEQLPDGGFIAAMMQSGFVRAPAGMTPTVKILLIEDSPSDARLTQEKLRGSGIECDVAAALAEVTMQRLVGVDCVLIDLGLPDASGLQALDRVREMAPQLPTVVLTGFDDEVIGLVALRKGAQDYLVKQYADGRAIVRSIRFAAARKHLTMSGQSSPNLNVTDDVIQQLFAIGLALGTTRRRTAEREPELAARMTDHMHELQQVIRRIRDTIINSDPGDRRVQPHAALGAGATAGTGSGT